MGAIFSWNQKNTGYDFRSTFYMHMVETMEKMKLIPLENHVIVETQEQETTTASWLIMQTSTKEKPNKGIVIAVWPWAINDDGTRAPMDVAVDDTVYFTKYAPDEIEVAGKEYLIIKVTSILAKEA